MSLHQWASNGWWRPHQSSPKEIQDLLAIVKRDLADAGGNISADWQFGIAYNAALKLCTVLRYASGYRPEKTLQHYRTLQALPLILGPERKADADYLDACRIKRNTVEYDYAGAAKQTALLEKARAGGISAPPPGPEPKLDDIVEKIERERLFDIIRELVKWENSNDPRVLAAARAEIMRSCNGKPPPVYDPFCGGGSIPLEAQRLGLDAHASDLNPIPVLINKALIEIPPKFAAKPPVNPEATKKLGASGSWKGAAGLVEDILYYGQWMRDEAQKRIGHLYPKVRLPKDLGGGEAMVIAWLWVRTVRQPQPSAKGAHVPLKGGKVRLLKKEELDLNWDPATDRRLTIWEMTHHLIRRLEQGESGAAEFVQELGAKAEVARDLSYRLYTICERRKWANEAVAYNTLVLSWGDVQRLAEEREVTAAPTQGELL